MEVLIQSSPAAATELVAQMMARQLRTNPRSVLGLATGRTMEAVYRQLAQQHRTDGLDFSHCRTFNLDEYVGLPASSANSYRHYMNEQLFRHVNVDLQQTHVPNGVAADLNAECEDYERLIAAAGGIDLQLLGIGDSGHIGFNEPYSEFTSRTRVVDLASATIRQNASYFNGAANVPKHAITMGIGTILACRRCILLATGADKATIVAQAIEGSVTPKVPASALHLHPHCTVVLDAAAAGKLREFSSCYQAAPRNNISSRA